MATKHANELSDADYFRFRDLLLERSGLHFPPNKRRDLELGLANALKDAGIDDLDAYYHRLATGTTTDLTWENLIQHLTIGETYFFRNAAHFGALRDHILPELIQQRRASNLKMLRLWSAGCATGEEPYSIAILLRQLIPDIQDWNIMLLATDINRESLMAAQRGIYRPWSFRTETPAHYKEAYFSRMGNLFELKPEIRRMVTFAYLNLARAGYPSVESHTVGMDLILCRNVTIYFDRQTTQAVVERLHMALLDWGWLILGHSEFGVADYNESLIPRQFEGTAAYQKVPTVPAPTFTELPPPVPQKAPARTTPRRKAPLKKPTGDTSPLDLYQLALALTDSDQVEEAKKQLEILLAESARHAEACWLMGKIYADQQDWKAAQDWLKQATDIDPLMPQAHYLIGLVYEEQELVEEAVVAYKRALYADHNFILAHFSLGNLYAAVGMSKDARRHWNNAADLLYRCAPDDVISFSEGLTVRRLLPVIQSNLASSE